MDQDQQEQPLMANQDQIDNNIDKFKNKIAKQNLPVLNFTISLILIFAIPVLCLISNGSDQGLLSVGGSVLFLILLIFSILGIYGNVNNEIWAYTAYKNTLAIYCVGFIGIFIGAIISLVNSNYKNFSKSTGTIFAIISLPFSFWMGLSYYFAIKNKAKPSQPVEYCTPIGKQNKDDKLAIRQEWKDFNKDYLKDSTFNLGIVCSFGYMIPSYVINKFQGNMIVIHPSILPKYRGASPIHHALLDGEKETASENIIEVLKNMENLKQIPQDSAKYTPAPKIELKETNIDFENQSSDKIYNQYRALNGSSFSSVRTNFEGAKEQIFITKMNLPSQAECEILEKAIQKQNQQQKKPKCGQIFILSAKSYKNNIYVLCQDNKFIAIKEWRLATQGKSKQAYMFVDQFIDKQKCIKGEQQFYFY
ncbi:Formyl transferase, N-terminal [Pseudocohnilembus persalinus]|uniref:Formyl transferase, N-terminal n=1 Tax=Pseudocohnilembus persalinus TaxID=266149 RepID=A0A0V0QM81_PSEPJ|nr:Formyl transferase, N-terminal [Pseudocohnilembus persalinus]|eukprot:KRX03334.1 Formyl transferase, N-terminal [Pseudocohnilembus persalinus]